LGVLGEVLRSARVIVCVGSGGVGKTSLSAALGVAATTISRRPLVLTVDPAKRLANALGLRSFHEEEQVVTRRDLANVGADAQVDLRAAMLDTKRTFDRVIERHVGDPERRARILGNVFYRQASTALAGSQEYMAMERLYEVVAERDLETIILDTPPSAHALDFLDAPNRMEELLDSSAFRAFMVSTSTMGRLGLSAFKRPGIILRGVGKFTGSELFLGILDFLASFGDAAEGFTRRAQQVRSLLRTPEVAFVIVAGTDPASLDEALHLAERLEAERMRVGAFVINRVIAYPGGDVVPVATEVTRRIRDLPGLERYTDGEVRGAAKSVTEIARRMSKLAERDHDVVAAFARQVGARTPVVAVPRFQQEVCDLTTLCRLAKTAVAATPETGGDAA